LSKKVAKLLLLKYEIGESKKLFCCCSAGDRSYDGSGNAEFGGGSAEAIGDRLNPCQVSLSHCAGGLNPWR
jgi:hypothetical protein